MKLPDRLAVAEEVYVFDFARRMAGGDTISSASVVVTQGTATSIAEKLVVDGTTVTFGLRGGASGTIIEGYVLATTSSGEKPGELFAQRIIG